MEVIVEVFIERIKESNMFSKEEINNITLNYEIYLKSYFLGLIDNTKICL